jgi:hypothetical protein
MYLRLRYSKGLEERPHQRSLNSQLEGPDCKPLLITSFLPRWPLVLSSCTLRGRSLVLLHHNLFTRTLCHLLSCGDSVSLSRLPHFFMQPAEHRRLRLISATWMLCEMHIDRGYDAYWLGVRGTTPWCRQVLGGTESPHFRLGPRNPRAEACLSLFRTKRGWGGKHSDEAREKSLHGSFPVRRRLTAAGLLIFTVKADHLASETQRMRQAFGSYS